MATTAAELEPLPGAGAAGLLTFNGPGVPGQQAAGPELEAVHAVDGEQGAGNPEPHGAGLASDAAAVTVGHDVERAEGVGGRERLLNVLDQRGTGEVIA